MPSDCYIMQNLQQNFTAKVNCQPAMSMKAAKPQGQSGKNGTVPVEHEDFQQTLQRMATRTNQIESDNKFKKCDLPAADELQGNADCRQHDPDSLSEATLLVGASHSLPPEKTENTASCKTMPPVIIEALKNVLLQLVANQASSNNTAGNDLAMGMNAKLFQDAEIDSPLAGLQKATAWVPSSDLKGIAALTNLMVRTGSQLSSEALALEKLIEQLTPKSPLLSSEGQSLNAATHRQADHAIDTGKINLGDILKAFGANPNQHKSGDQNFIKTDAKTASHVIATDLEKSLFANMPPHPQTKVMPAAFENNMLEPAKALSQTVTLKSAIFPEPGQIYLGQTEAKTPQRMGSGFENHPSFHYFNQNQAGNQADTKNTAQPQNIDIAGLKTVFNVNEALDGKTVAVDSVVKEAGALISASQPETTPAENQIPAKTVEFVPRELASETLNQIVQKAALHLGNGQNEVKLELKPDFLGQLRMQIITENHHVTVRVIAESHFVKDLIENNFHQLRQDLQSQGLKIDQMEVSVAGDAGTHKENHQKMIGKKMHSAIHANHHDENDGPEETMPNNRGADGSMHASGIDLRV